MRTTLGSFSLCIILLASCAPQQPAAEPLAPPPVVEPVASAPPAAPEAAPEPPKPPELTAEQKVKVYQDCWAAFNAKDMAKFGDCYADNAIADMVDSGMPMATSKAAILEQRIKPFTTAFPDVTGEPVLTLQNGNVVFSVALLKGTNKAPLMTPKGELPATNKKFGMLTAHIVELQNGKVIKQWEYTDERSLLGQLGQAPGPVRKAMDAAPADKPVVIATGSDAEKANVETFKKASEAFNKHDAAAFEALLADDIVLSEVYAPADRVGKKEVMKGWKENWKAFSDGKISHSSIWAAGDYVVATGTFSGTNDGSFNSMKIWTKTGKPLSLQSLEVAKLENGKLKKHWLFSNGMAFAAQMGLLPPEKKAKAKAAPVAAAKPEAAKPAPAAAAKPEAGKPAASAANPAAKPAAHAAAAPAAPPPAAPAAPKAAAPATPTPAGKPAAPAAPAAPAKPAPAAPAAPPAK